MKANFSKFLLTAVWGLFLLLLSRDVSAQDRRVSGRITGPDGPIPGVNVVLRGSSTGTTTDANGNFQLSVRGNNPVLSISAIGFKSQQVTVGSQSLFNLALEEDASTLNEVVVTGYTTDLKKDLTGAVASVKPRDLNVAPTGNVEQLIQGRAAGVTVITNGQPGTNSIIRVRGFGSFGGNDPLYVVDGVPISDRFNGINFISPDDIESFQVLKDPSTASIYGARAASGVVVITTKKGQRNAGKLTITYDGLYGVTNPGTPPGVLDPQGQADWTWRAIQNTATQTGTAPVFEGAAGGQYGSSASGPVLPDYINVGGAAGVRGTVDLAAERAKYNVSDFSRPIYQVVRANKAGTNWYDAITRNAVTTRNTIGVAGGTETGRFYFGLSQQGQEGILLNQRYDRYTFRANSEFNLLRNLRFGENIQLTYQRWLGLTGGTRGQNSAAEENDILTAFRMPPIIPVYDEFGGYAGTAAKGFNNPRNPLATRERLANDRSFDGAVFGNLYLEYDPIPGLTLRSTFGGQYRMFYGNFYAPRQYENSENNSAYAYGESAGFNYNWTLTNTANYKTTFGQHAIDVLVGQEALNTGIGRSMGGQGLNPFSTDPNFVTLSNTQGVGRVVNSGFGLGITFSSLFARAVYTFNDRYTITGVVRRDGSSRFGPSTRYGVFPSVSAGWTISNEEFMKNVPAISFLRLRGGYGLMGNSNNVDPNNQFSLYATSINRGYDIAGSNTSVADGFARSRIGNPDAKWETSVGTDIGFDATLLNGKVDFSLSLWRKDTRDLLFRLPLPGVVGTSAQAPEVNIAAMRNQGIDIQIVNRGVISGDLRYEVDVNGSFLQNTVQSLAPGVPNFELGGTRLATPVVRVAPGQALSTFFGYRVIGLFQSKAEVDAAPTQTGAAPGRFRYADINGDGTINADDRTFLGSAVPKFTGGLTTTLRYKNFDLAAFFNASLGNKIFNNSRWFTDFYPSFTGAAISDRVLNSWTPQNTGAEVPIFENISNFSTNTQASSYYVESGNYLRLQNITLGYTLPTALLNRAKLSRLRVFVQAQNLFTITNYSGLDPQVGGAADTGFGVDVGNYPVTPGFNAGLGLTF